MIKKKDPRETRKPGGEQEEEHNISESSLGLVHIVPGADLSSFSESFWDTGKVSSASGNKMSQRSAFLNETSRNRDDNASPLLSDITPSSMYLREVNGPIGEEAKSISVYLREKSGPLGTLEGLCDRPFFGIPGIQPEQSSVTLKTPDWISKSKHATSSLHMVQETAENEASFHAAGADASFFIHSEKDDVEDDSTLPAHGIDTIAEILGNISMSDNSIALGDKLMKELRRKKGKADSGLWTVDSLYLKPGSDSNDSSTAVEDWLTPAFMESDSCPRRDSSPTPMKINLPKNPNQKQDTIEPAKKVLQFDGSQFVDNTETNEDRPMTPMLECDKNMRHVSTPHTTASLDETLNVITALSSATNT
ncbi:unnamed protein product [Darwinula stevensoni]|uniref:Uncharacterized protein n=1 Tax=Darwinula stevensoni TaxID=69355 RepID=A0A7R8X7D8_9CRUS|nr:unnamed protein product [Darwinula stevensoni]CAG0886778.1 unnamed protein product [Darwinula stevensoni]